jgi:cytochrome b561
MNVASELSPGARYTRTAIHLHWLIAGLILCAFVVGWVMMQLPVSPLRVRLVNWHKWIGISVLMLAVLRVLWRLKHPAPALIGMPRWQRILAHGLHGLFYGLLFLMPISGWFSSNAAGYPVVYLGLLRLPTLVEKNKPLSQLLHGVHHQIGLLLLIAVGLHVAAVIKHQFFDRDGTLDRMLLYRVRSGMTKRRS